MEQHAAPQPARARSLSDVNRHVPVHVVWEITLSCNLKCQHCGSRAGKRRSNELSTEEAFSVIDQLAALGTREITLIGGEAYLRRDWLQLVERIANHGIRCGMQTGARALTRKRLEDGKEAGLFGIGVSLDGMEDLHDRLRGVKGSWREGLLAIETAKEIGLGASCNTQIGAETIDHLEPLFNRLIQAGASHWQLQITVAMGNAVENDHLLLQPHRILELMPMLARLYSEGLAREFLLTFGNNLGYFGPYEHLWRGFGDENLHWTGCAAGQNVIGLEADGTIKGCPSLATETYGGGNVRLESVADLWNHSPELHFGRLRDIDSLWGFCRTCYYADVCRGGCTWTSDSLFGKPGNNPYCHYRALELEKRGVRETIRKVAPAPNKPFATGLFELIEEPIPGRAVVPAAPRPEPFRPVRNAGAPLPRMTLCRNCSQYVWPHERTCPHCSADIVAAQAHHDREIARQHVVLQELRTVLDRLKQLTTP